jgi:2-dehydropantoate 2-reductase
VHVCFLARGAHLEAIRSNGLRVIKGSNEFVARPAAVSDQAHELGVAEVIVICTKSYDLEATIEQLKPCINERTIILPLLNGVDSKERIKSLLPNNMVLQGCAYIVSRLTQPGVIENSGNIETIFFGDEVADNARLIHLEELFKKAGIDARLSSSISNVIWEKFIFLSPIATATSYFDQCIGKLLEDEHKVEMVIALICELKQLASANQILFPDDIVETTLKKYHRLPYITTTSMHADFQAKKPLTELESLTGYILQEGTKLNLTLPYYSQAYAALRARSDY